MTEEPTITVCAACLMASCWQGVWLCEEARQADITQKTVAELTALGLEHPDYWADECTASQVRIKVRQPSLKVAKAAERAQGQMDGLRKAARIQCVDCDRAHKGLLNVQPAVIADALWIHKVTPSGLTTRSCHARRIRDAINDIERHGA